MTAKTSKYDYSKFDEYFTEGIHPDVLAGVLQETQVGYLELSLVAEANKTLCKPITDYNANENFLDHSFHLGKMIELIKSLKEIEE